MGKILQLLRLQSPPITVVDPVDTSSFPDVPSYDEALLISDDDLNDFLDTFTPEGDEDEDPEEIELLVWHPKVHTTRGTGLYPSRVTVVYGITNDSVFFATAYCSPKDQWNRAKGRDLAIERLENGDFVEFSTNGRLTASQARELIAGVLNIGHLITLPHFPANQQIVL